MNVQERTIAKLEKMEKFHFMNWIGDSADLENRRALLGRTLVTRAVGYFREYVEVGAAGDVIRR
jgi:hypothetical protein